MKIYANRYGMIDSLELSFALQNAALRRHDADARGALRAARRAARSERWRTRLQQASRRVADLAAELRAAMLRHAV